MNQLRQGRKRAGLTQVEAAARLGVSQPYLSLLECGKRKLTGRVAQAMTKLYDLAPTALPLPAEPRPERGSRQRLPHELAGLSYPGFSHLRRSRPANPALVVLEALSGASLDARVAQALPWVLAQYSELDWKWLVTHARMRNVQNKLGFLVSLAAEVAERQADWATSAPRLQEVARELEKSRLANEASLSGEDMPRAEKAWLRANRPPLASHWNVLTNMTAEHLPYA